MELLDFFKRKNKPVAPSINKEDSDISTTDNFLMVWPIDFFGSFSSPYGIFFKGDLKY